MSSSSSDDVVEQKSPPKQGRRGKELLIKVSEEEDRYREDCFSDVSKVLKEEIACTVCGENLKPGITSGKEVFYHPHLRVLLCETCREDYKNGEFSPDEDGSDKYCRWCSNGGSLYCCAKCVCAFCKHCIKRNFGRGMLKDLDNKDFECFICQPEPLFKSRAICYAAAAFSRGKRKEKSLSQKIRVSELAEKKRLGIKAKRSERKPRSRTPESSQSEGEEPSSSSKVKIQNKKVMTKNNSHLKSQLSAKTSSSGELTDSDFEPKSSQRFKPLNLKTSSSQRRKSNEEVIPFLNGNPPTCINLDSADDSIPNQILVKSLADDALCTVSVLQSRVKECKKSLESCESGLLSYVVGQLQSSIKRAVQSLLDIGEGLDSLNPISSNEDSNICKRENDGDEISNKDKETSKVETQNSVHLIEDSDECDLASPQDKLIALDSKPEPEGSVKSCPSPNPDGSDDEALSETAHKAQRCGSTESESGEDVKFSKEARAESECKENSASRVNGTSCDSPGNNASPQSSGSQTNSPSKMLNFSVDLFGDDDFGHEPNSSTTGEANSKNNPSPNRQTAQSSNSLACKANLMADSSSDSERESTSKHCISKSVSSDSDLDTQPSEASSPRRNKQKFDIRKLDIYQSDNKLQGECSVDIEAMDPVQEKKYLELAANYYSKSTSESDDDDDDKSINNLVNLNNLKRKGKRSEGDNDCSVDNKAKKAKAIKGSMPNPSEASPKLVDFLNKSETEAETSLGNQSDSVASLNAGKGDISLNEANKRRLLQSSDSEDNISDDEDTSKLPGKSKGQIGGEEESKCDNAGDSGDDQGNNEEGDGGDDQGSNEEGNGGDDQGNNEDGDGGDGQGNTKEATETQSDSDDLKKKPDWRQNKLLTGKLSDTDTSDDERKWSKKKKLTGDKSRKSKSPRKKKGAQSESDNPSSSTSEDFVKKKKRKVVKNTSSSSSSESEKERRKKKRRRFKIANSSSNSSSDEESKKKEESPLKGRKKIKHIMHEDELEEGTKEAAKEEEERLKRIAARQKMYEELYDNVQKGFATVDKLILDFDEKTKKPLVEVHPTLVKKLKPHQAQGVKFMWDACFESLKTMEKKKGSGCILAHCMGLGKTFQVVTLVHTLFFHPATKVNRVLVVCPVSTVLNWVNEFQKWLNDVDEGPEIEVFELTRCKQNVDRSYRLKEWIENGGVMIMGYDMYRNLSNPESKRVRVSIMKTFQTALVDPGPDLVICDEGHLLKNEDTATSKAMTRIKTLRRIVLTGTPLQNNLKEYHCMVQFVKPNLLGNKKEFCNRFVNPITNGQFEDSTAHDVKRMKRRAHVLHKTLEGSVQRFDYSVLTPFLPSKEEYVISVRLSELQEKLYSHYLEHFSSKGYQGKGAQLFADFQSLQKIWTHPRVLKLAQERDENKTEKEEEDSEGSLRDFIDDGDENSETSSPSSSSSENDDDDDDVICLSDGSTKSKKKKSKENKKSVRRTRSCKEPLEPEPLPPPKQRLWWESFVEDSDLDDLRASPKLVLLFSILQDCEKNGEKLLVFSQSLFSLDVIEHFLSLIDEATQKNEKSELLDGHQGSWSPGIDYFRLDGSTPTELRSTWCNTFNRPSNSKGRLFLISTRAGGLGINLVAANRVVIFDASWNPSHDVQSIFRVYRFGQKRPCFIYRFLAQGTMEEKIYERQVTKLSLACRVVDEQQIERYYKMADLQELYSFTPADRASFVPPKLPKDHLFAEILKKHKSLITKYHEHDSLLENKEEEELNEEERKAAWEDYENEKKPTVNQGYLLEPEPIPTQEQLEVALRLRHPDMTEEQVKHAAAQSLQQIIQIHHQKQQQYQLQLLQQQQREQAFRQKHYEQAMLMQMQQNYQSALNQNAMFQQYQQFQNNQQANVNYGAGILNRQPYANPSMPSHSRQGNIQQARPASHAASGSWNNQGYTEP